MNENQARENLVKRVRELAEALGPVPGLPYGFPDTISNEEMENWLATWEE